MGQRWGSLRRGAPGAREVKSEQVFRRRISPFPCLHLPLECSEAREAAASSPSSPREGRMGSVHAGGEGNGLILCRKNLKYSKVYKFFNPSFVLKCTKFERHRVIASPRDEVLYFSFPHTSVYTYICVVICMYFLNKSRILRFCGSASFLVPCAFALSASTLSGH